MIDRKIPNVDINFVETEREKISTRKRRKKEIADYKREVAENLIVNEELLCSS